MYWDLHLIIHEPKVRIRKIWMIFYYWQLECLPPCFFFTIDFITDLRAARVEWRKSYLDYYYSYLFYSTDWHGINEVALSAWFAPPPITHTHTHIYTHAHSLLEVDRWFNLHFMRSENFASHALRIIQVLWFRQTASRMFYLQWGKTPVWPVNLKMPHMRKIAHELFLQKASWFSTRELWTSLSLTDHSVILRVPNLRTLFSWFFHFCWIASLSLSQINPVTKVFTQFSWSHGFFFISLRNASSTWTVRQKKGVYNKCNDVHLLYLGHTRMIV